MGVVERKSRRKAEREHRIIAAARAIAANEGWSAVTIRRLADEVEYSQPVLYSHFKSRDAIVASVAVEGFGELANTLHNALGKDPRKSLHDVAAAYLGFARDNVALYQAMFTMPTDLRFAGADTVSELKDAFSALAAAVPPSTSNVEVATETLWAALHGLAELEVSGRIRAHARDERLALVVDGFMLMETCTRHASRARS